jgi:hypothetical protein
MMMKLPSSTNDEKRKRKMTIRSFSPQFTRVFGISSIIAIARSTDQTRFFLEADAAAVTPIPATEGGAIEYARSSLFNRISCDR